MSKNYLSKNDELRKGDFLLSNNKQWKAIFQEDGNFVIYGWKPFWASDTDGTDGMRVCMQEDCNLVMYNRANQPKWSTDTYKQTKPNMCRLHLTDAGKLVVSRESEQIWHSDQNHGKK